MNSDWNPKMHISSTEAQLVVEVEMGGIRSEDLEIIAEANRLRVSGRHAEHGSFTNHIDVAPDFSLPDARANLFRGILRIEVPRHTGSPPATLL
jgi:HSP20 family molecular chaperone IbpA